MLPFNAIVVGRTYSDAKGANRLIVKRTALAFSGQPEDEWLSYIVAENFPQTPAALRKARSCTRRVFAAWAKVDVTVMDVAV